MSFKNLFQGLMVDKVARDHPVSYFDVGSRGGFQGDLEPLAFAVDAIGFEPEPEEFAGLTGLSNTLWRTAKYLPYGVSRQGGRQTLYIPTDPQSASLMRHNGKIGEQFDKRQFFELANTVEVETKTLSDALADTDVQSIDFLKIDIEGPELEVISASPELLSGMLAVKTEVSFLEFRHDQPLAHQVDEFMHKNGFILMDLIGPAHWRREGYVIHPLSANVAPPYSKGQIMQGDFLYLRDPETLTGMPGAQVKLALIAMSLGYFDHALMIFEKPEMAEYLCDKYGLTPLEAVGQASKRYGRKIIWQALYRQLRGLVPLLRSALQVLRR